MVYLLWEHGKCIDTNRILRLKSIYQLRLFKFLRALLDGRIPELYDLLLRPYIAHHNYGTRGGRFRHPNLTCEIERRFLSYQLIIMYEQLPDHFFVNLLSPSLRSFRQYLLNIQ